MVEHIDHVLPFRLEKHAVTGRVVRLTHVAHDILSRHDYPSQIAVLLGEALALVAMLGTALKFDGRLSVQMRGDGPMTTLLADYNSDGGLRGLARYDVNYFTDGHPIERDTPEMLFGKGHLTMNIERKNQKPYQGIVPIVGYSISDIADNYFRRSEQLASGIRLSAACDKNQQWCVGGILLQQIAQEGGRSLNTTETKSMSSPQNKPTGQSVSEDDWRRLKFLLQTADDDELLDPSLPPPQLAYRLFHEDGVRIYPPRELAFQCNCTELRVLNMLHSLPESERVFLAEEQYIEVRCEFCNQAYLFPPDVINTDKAH